MSWEIYTRGAIPPFRFDLVWFGAAKYGPEYNGGHVCSVFVCNIDEKLWFCWERKALEKIGEHIIAQTATPEKRQAHFSRMQEVRDRAMKAAEKVRAMDLEGMDDEGLADAYEEYLLEVWPAHGFLDVDIDAVDVVPAERLKEHVRKELGLNEKEFAEAWRILSAPTYKSYLQDEEEMLLTIAKEGSDDYSEVLEKYWWTSLGWESLGVQTVEKYKERVEKFTDVEARLREIREYAVRTKREKEALYEKYRVPEKIRYGLDLFNEYTLWHDKRKEMQCVTVRANDLFLQEIARRKGKAHDDLEWLLHHEALALLRTGAIDEEMIARRKVAIAALVERGDMAVWEGEEAIAKKEGIVPPIDTSLAEVRGESASKGLVRGVARVCVGVQEANRKVREGEILITGMTLPDCLPAMKKAAAIVTDEGGITCHAAIVAREMGKPCVIGTEHATRVFKDGDLVEVDADKGVVRKVKK